jgi:hypothetical protein
MLMAQVSALQAQLNLQKRSEPEEDAGYATDEDKEDSCRGALRHWRQLEACIEYNERHMGAFVSTELPKNDFMAAWRERLRLLPSSPLYLQGAVTKQLGRLAVAFDVAMCDFGDGNARLEYLARKNLRLQLEDAGELVLRISGVDAAGYTEYSNLLVKSRRTNRTRKSGYVGLDSIIADVLTKHRTKRSQNKANGEGGKPGRSSSARRSSAGPGSITKSPRRGSSDKPKKDRDEE